MYEEKDETQTNASNGPTYYGEIPWFAGALKTLISVISILVFLITLFSEEHDVRGFYNELVIFISPIGINLLSIYTSIKNNKNITTCTSKLFIVAISCASICFVVSMVILLLSGQNITPLDNYLKGSYWGITIVLFPFVIIPFLIDLIRPVSLEKSGIKTEHRE